MKTKPQLLSSVQIGREISHPVMSSVKCIYLGHTLKQFYVMSGAIERGSVIRIQKGMLVDCDQTTPPTHIVIDVFIDTSGMYMAEVCDLKSLKHKTIYIYD